MVKSPDLLGGLLDKKVDRRRILEIAGFTGAVAALAACSGETTENQERSKQVPIPSLKRVTSKTNFQFPPT